MEKLNQQKKDAENHEIQHDISMADVQEFKEEDLESDTISKKQQ